MTQQNSEAKTERQSPDPLRKVREQLAEEVEEVEQAVEEQDPFKNPEILEGGESSKPTPEQRKRREKIFLIVFAAVMVGAIGWMLYKYLYFNYAYLFFGS